MMQPEQNNILTDANTTYSNVMTTGVDGYDDTYAETNDPTAIGNYGTEFLSEVENTTEYADESTESSDEEIFGSQADDFLVGNNGNNKLNGYEGQDTLTGGEGSDIFEFTNPSDSPLSNFDTITDLNLDEDRIVGTKEMELGSIAQFGSVDSLDEAAIGTVLNESDFLADTAGIFTFGSQTFLVFNDGVAGFSEQSDLVIEITGVRGLITDEADTDNTIDVDSDFNGDLEAAIACANDGDIVELNNSTYFTDGITIDKDITIDGKEGSVVDGNGTQDSIFNLTSEATGTTIQDLRITNGNNGINSNGAFDLTIQNLEIDNIGLSNIIRDGQNNTGIILNRADGLQLSDTFVHDIGRKGVGINDTDGAQVSNLTIQNINLAAEHAQSFDAAGIKFYNTNAVVVSSLNLSRINAFGIWNDTSNGTVIENNSIENVGNVFLAPDFNQFVNIAGIYAEKSPNSIVIDNMVTTVGDFLAFNATEFTTETLVLENNDFSTVALNTQDFWVNEGVERLIATTEDPDAANFELFADEFFDQANIN